MPGDGTTATVPPTVVPWAPPDRPVARRVTGLLLALGCGLVLGLAVYLTPSGDGIGTHEALGLPPCSWVVNMDMPCPTCGMTTAFAHAAHGELGSALLAQPLGFVLAVLTAMLLILGIHQALTGSRLLGTMMSKVWTRWTPWIIGILLLGSWGWKIISYKELLG